MSSYTRELVESLVPAIWDESSVWGMVDQYEPDPDMPRSRGLKNRGNTLWAHLADIRQAFARAGLSDDEARALLLCSGVGLSHSQAGKELSVPKSTIQLRHERAIGKLAAYLNGNDATDGDEDTQ